MFMSKDEFLKLVGKLINIILENLIKININKIVMDEVFLHTIYEFFVIPYLNEIELYLLPSTTYFNLNCRFK